MLELAISHIVYFVIIIAMQGALSLERILSLLNAQGHVYLYQRALVEACSNGKTLLSIFKDLIEEAEPSYIRSWMATEGISFFQDVQKNRLCFPAICDYLAVSEVMQILGGHLKLQMFSQKGSERNWTHLSKILSFLEAREEIFKTTEKQRQKHQIMQRTFKKKNQAFQEMEKRRKQTLSQKQREKPTYQLKMKQLALLLQEVKRQSNELNELTTNNMKMNEQLRNVHEIRLAEVKRNNQQLQIRISQCKRQLCKITPDIRKRRQHIDKKLKEANDRKNYKQNLGQQLVQSYANYARQAKTYQQNLAKLELQLTEQLHNIEKQTKNKEKLELEIQQVEKEVSSHEIRYDKQCKEKARIQLKLVQEKESVDKLILERNSLNGQLDWEIEQLTKQQLLSSQSASYKKQLIKQREKVIREAEDTCKAYEKMLEEKNRQFRQWKSKLQNGIKELQKPLMQFMK